MKDDKVIMTEKDRQILEYICKDLCPEKWNAGDEEQFTEAIESVKHRDMLPDSVKQAIDAMRVVFGYAPSVVPVTTVYGKINKCIEEMSDEICDLSRRIQILTVNVRQLTLVKAAIDAVGLEKFQYPDGKFV